MDVIYSGDGPDFLGEISLEISELLDSKTNPGLDGIIELTYGYTDFKNGRRFNTTLFKKFCGVDYIDGQLINIKTREVINYQELIILFKSKAQGYIDAFGKIIASLEGYTSVNDVVRKDSIVASIENIITTISYAQNSIEFEVEKIGIEIELSEAEREKKRKSNEEFEFLLYGGKIINNPVESSLICDFLDGNIAEYKQKTESEKQDRIDSGYATRILNIDELARLKGYITKIKGSVIHTHKNSEIGTLKKEPASETKRFLDTIENVTISREKAVEIFNGVLEFLKLPQRVRVSDEVQSIYDSPTELVIPDSDEFSNLGVERVLKLISHEILGHYINQYNHERFNGSMRFVGNVEKEEGLAILFEKGLTGTSLLGSSLITPPFARILAGETLNSEEFEDFIDLYSEISERKLSPTALRNRHKRNQEDNFPSVQHKDVAYIRGLIAIVEFLKNGGDIENLFVGKVGLDAIKNGVYKFDENMLFPFLITDVFVFFVLSSKESLTFSHEGFKRYMRSKYLGVIKDESFKKLEKILTKSDLLRICTILRPLSEAIESSGISANIASNITRIHSILDRKSKL